MATRKSTPATSASPHPSGASARWPAGNLRSWTIAALPILNHLFQRMNLEAILEAHLPARDGRGKLPVARGLLVLVQNVLLAREPLYGLGEWAARYEPRLLGLTAEQIGTLNDDRIGRCLTALFHANRPGLILDLIRHVVQAFDVGLDELHNDSTSISFFGAYAGAAAEKTARGQAVPAITWGHSKDHRPDLKQLLYILTVSSDGGVPVHCRVASGNVVDDTTHRDNWDMLCRIRGGPDFLYVADCKLVTRDNLRHIATHGGRFVSVLPRTWRADAAFRDRLRAGTVVWQPLWDKRNDQGVVDAFSVLERHEVLADGFRLWWYYSTHKAELDLASRSDRLRRAEQQLRQLQAKLRSPRSRQRDRAKVEERVRQILEHHDVDDLLRVDVVERGEATYRQRRRGRPGKDTEYVKHVRLQLDLDQRIDDAALTQARKTDGIFPLVTNDAKLSALDVLQTYKHQPTIEKRFEQLKTDFAVAPVWLKDVKRIEGLLHVYFIVLLVEALLERELRLLGMKRAGLESLPLYPESRPCRCPTARRVIDVFDPVQRHTLESANGATTTSVTDLTPLQRRLLRLLGLPAETYGD